MVPTEAGTLLWIHPARGWISIGKPPGSNRYRYKDREGVCRSVTLTPGRVLKAVCKGAGVGFTLNEAISVKKHAVALPEGTFNCFTGTCRRGNLTVPTVFLRHPASLRLTRDSKKRVVDELVKILSSDQ